VTFAQLQQRLLGQLRHRIQSGESTERSLARLAGISQPHLHNVMKGKRMLSIEMADTILHNLRIDLLDLLQPEERPSHRTPEGRQD
jgi:transcriptional regulator with XRE-family HTH domain